MVSLLGIIVAIAAGLAVVVTSLVIGVCLAAGWISDAVRGRDAREAPGPGGRARLDRGDMSRPGRGVDGDWQPRSARNSPSSFY